MLRKLDISLKLVLIVTSLILKSLVIFHNEVVWLDFLLKYSRQQLYINIQAIKRLMIKRYNLFDATLTTGSQCNTTRYKKLNYKEKKCILFLCKELQYLNVFI